MGNKENKKVKKPLPDISLFMEFHRNPNLGKYFLVKQNDKILGGILCPIYKGIIYEWYTGSLRNSDGSKYSGVLATWAPIKYALDNNIRMFDFMGAGSPKTDYGVRQFKSQFGGRLVNYGRFTKINNNFLYMVGKIVINLNQKFS